MGTHARAASFAILMTVAVYGPSMQAMASPLAIRPLFVSVLASGSVAQTRFPLTDALGTTNGVADSNGVVVERDYFDSWGLRSNADGTPLPNLTLFQSLSSGGYTNQEHDDELALINMQGRLYDSALGRFLSPDPLVGNPAFTESWNAYSYVTNSPLNFTDPSGFDPCPPGFYCATAPGNEITNTIQWQFGNETFGDGTNTAAIGATPGSDVAGVVMSAFAFMHDQQRLAEQQHKFDTLRNPRAYQGSSSIRSADGTSTRTRQPSNDFASNANTVGSNDRMIEKLSRDDNNARDNDQPSNRSLLGMNISKPCKPDGKTCGPLTYPFSASPRPYSTHLRFRQFQRAFLSELPNGRSPGTHTQSAMRGFLPVMLAMRTDTYERLHELGLWLTRLGELRATLYESYLRGTYGNASPVPMIKYIGYLDQLNESAETYEDKLDNLSELLDSGITFANYVLAHPGPL